MNNLSSSSSSAITKKALLEEYELKARILFPDIELELHSLDDVMYVLVRGDTQKRLSPVVSSNEMFLILYTMCNLAREELFDRLESFKDKRELERLFQEQEYERQLWQEEEQRK